MVSLARVAGLVMIFALEGGVIVDVLLLEAAQPLFDLVWEAQMLKADLTHVDLVEHLLHEGDAEVLQHAQDAVAVFFLLFSSLLSETRVAIAALLGGDHAFVHLKEGFVELTVGTFEQLVHIKGRVVKLRFV